MLTKRENFMETIKGGNPDRFVNQYEALGLIFGAPFSDAMLEPGQEYVNGWGVTIRYLENTPGAFPVHDDEHRVLKDILQWKKYVKAPNLKFSDEDWAIAKSIAAEIDRNEQFVTVPFFTGVFEQLHYLMGMEDTLMNFYEEPEAMHELIDYITDWELNFAKEFIEHINPDALFHHDDWGSQISSFLSPEMFNEFILPAYKKIYGYYKENGIEIIVHHSDSYAANLVPAMIEMGIDVWQGCISTNNIPELIKKYGGQISFMGGINNGIVDVPDWTPELIAQETEKVCRECGKLYFIPNATMGGPDSTYPGVYDAVSAEIDRMSKKMY